MQNFQGNGFSFSREQAGENQLVFRSSATKKRKDPDGNRICHVCGKGFKSGQALGGHISIHFEPCLGPTKCNKFKLKHQQRLLGEHPPNYTISCHVCNKNFSTRKSLYGHMGSHRQRVVRPSPPGSESAEEDEHSNIIDQDFIVRSISKSANKNTKDQTISSHTMTTNSCNSLIANTCDNELTSKYRKFSSSKRAKYFDASIKDQHVCKICFKAFPTGQALGGHKRAHYVYEAVPISVAPPASIETEQVVSTTTSDYELEEGEIPSEPETELMKFAEEAIRLGDRRILDFDLNQPAPEEDE